MRKQIEQKYKDMVKMFKKLEAEKTKNGKALYKYTAMLDMVADKFYISSSQTQKIITKYYDEF
jgi:hypothetical protein